MLPPDNHVHTQWSWDADAGSMEASCARAVELGLPSIAFTDHMEFTRWVIAPEGRGVLHRDAGKVGPDRQFDAPPLDVDGYLECLQRCRDRFPGLRILMRFGSEPSGRLLVDRQPPAGEHSLLLDVESRRKIVPLPVGWES